MESLNDADCGSLARRALISVESLASITQPSARAILKSEAVDLCKAAENLSSSGLHDQAYLFMFVACKLDPSNKEYRKIKAYYSSLVTMQ